MTNNIAVRTQGLGKCFRLGKNDAVYRTLRETLTGFWRQKNAGHETLWALRDVDLEVGHGEVLGVIGFNGAGKSTLLKILARIMTPTEGLAEVHGRVGSLLEVGTGFHLELTGRENIYLSGIILGMRKQEIAAKFDEIVAFSGVEEFLDTPVKRYSSGMRVRLAFAVAAHLQPEILIVDEVLSVGDLQFQKKCLGKMKDVASSGRTVLFVSHNMHAVKRLCDTGILLDHGRIVHRGVIGEVVERFLKQTIQTQPGNDIPPERHRTWPPPLEVFRVELLNRHGECADFIFMDEDFAFRVHFRIHEPWPEYAIMLRLHSEDGQLLAVLNSSGQVDMLNCEPGRTYTLTARLRNVFSPGQYSLEVRVRAAPTLADVIEGIPITIAAAGTDSEAPMQEGIVQLLPRWSFGENEPGD